jgi:adenine-specific DNA-methyltransferase
MPETHLDKFKKLLAELFMFDQADLDFGIYRIMNAKRDEITRFLDRDLLPQVREALGELEQADRVAVEAELTKAIEQAKALGAEAESLPKVKELRQQLAQKADIEALESEVFSDLFSFFRRYYNEGDFLSLRRYKAGVYAIPYEGEEVKLHWANADQYYIKTTEYFRDYTFSVADGRRVHFKLVEADTEQNNNKPANGQERRFILGTADSIAEESGELVIRFEYRPDPEKQKQAELNVQAVRRILEAETARTWLAGLVSKPNPEKNPDRTLLDKRLADYTARNTFDYFIHKDVGGFLRRELDFYIKNEVMHLDDIESETVPRVDQYLARIKAIRRIAHKIIDFLAQLEEFQKKLWLKKKFVVETNYCITLDRVPEELYAEIATNDSQREEWVRLFAIDEITGDLTHPTYSVPLSIDFLKANKHLILDAAHFNEEFKKCLLQRISNLDEQTDGLVIQSENSQALQLVRERYKADFTCIYADPPYNSDAGPISYKNGYRHSSWIALMDDRLRLARHFLNDEGILCITIDDCEVHHLRALCDSIIAESELLGAVAIKNNPAGRTGTVGFSVCHEYALFYGMTERAEIDRLEHNEAQKARYKERDDIGHFEWTNFRKHGGLNTFREARPRQFYPIYVHDSNIRFPKMTWDDTARDYIVNDPPRPDEETLLPIDERGRERIWDFKVETAIKYLNHFKVRKDSTGATAIYRKWRISEEGILPKTWWDKSEYSAAEYGTNLLTKMFGSPHTFMFPKSVYAVMDCLRVSGLRNDPSGSVLDFFAGSGTTGHAIINLNREDGGSRKFVLAESGDYLKGVTLARLKKAVYANEWKDGKPTARSSGISHCIKYLRLESYEDTLNNLELKRVRDQGELLDQHAELREDYVLRYMLDVESNHSASLLDLERFEDPFNYRLNVSTGTAGETRPTNVDLVETFNWLLGLRVKHIDTIRGFRIVQGTNPADEKTLVIWRNTREKSNADLDEFFLKQGYNTRDMEFDLIYVNGDNNLENLKRPDETWKVRLIEEEFKNLMFNVEDV